MTCKPEFLPARGLSPILVLGLVLLLVVLLTACSGPGYYLQAMSGQWKLMHAREDIQSLLHDPDTKPDLITQLEAASRILAFAETTLGMPANGSYSSYVELDDGALVWNVVATEEFSLEPKQWCFVFIGCLPYRGFFKQQAAEKSLAKLHSKGMDVYLAAAPAYSTLGKFKDPLLSSMFTGSDIGIAAFLFHELAHQRLYIKGDGQFNESYASFIEAAGVQIWLQSSGRQTELNQWQKMRNAGADFNLLIADTRNELEEVYRSDISPVEKRAMKAATIERLVLSYDQLRVDQWEGENYYSGWFSEPINNAKLALYTTYEGSQCAFQKLFDDAAGNLLEFHRLAEQQSRIAKDQRDKWLMQSCAAIASTGKL